MRPSRFLLLALPFLLALGCQPAERAVLLEIYSAEDVADLRVIVQSLETPRRFQEPARRIDRTAAEIAEEPIRVVVSLAQSEYVLVHIVATTPAGDELYATRCYPIGGVIEDEVVLFGPLGEERDPDGDGFVEDAQTICRERGEDGNGTRFCEDDPYVCPSERASDCVEGAGGEDIHPGAPTICADGVDQDCDGVDEVCGDLDGDDVEACPAVPTLNCDCDDSLASINPFAMDACLDGIDQDCDGEDDCCDADGDGIVRCGDRPEDDCDDTNPAIPGAETCDGVDNDCNGLIDELDECRGPDLDGDGVAACGRPEAGDVCDCNDCDPSIHGGGQERCAPIGIDDDCDGMIDEGCPANDQDRDGVDASRDCNDADPLVFPPTDGREPIDRCGDDIANNCIPGEDTSCADDEDGDGWVEPAECEGDQTINPAAAESCDGEDDDCDGLIDEGLSNGMMSGCSESMPVDFLGDVTHCGGCRVTCDLTRADACVGGACVCPALGTGEQCEPGRTCCGEGCFDLMADEQHCGACGIACGEGEMCVGGQCRCGDVTAASGQACPDTTSGAVEDNICCGMTACRNVRNDNANCGMCGLSCGTNSTCINASCQCTGTWQDCDGDPSNGCEVNVDTNTDYCGSCTNACEGDQASWSCVGGECQVATCTGAYADCDGVAGNGCEIDTRSDEANCGGCGVACATGEVCSGATAGSCGPVCGNGYATSGEECDDGDLSGGDGCSSACLLETGWTCGASGEDPCTPICGDGSQIGGEQCDDANVVSGDGCSPSCTVEMGWDCSGGACTTVCGDGLRIAGEEACDDHNTANADGCSSTCTQEMGWTCTGDRPSVCTRDCGNGTVAGPEECDDGNGSSGDGCSDMCVQETGWTCTGTMPSTCTRDCGNGIVAPPEQCDDSNRNDDDGCSRMCTIEAGWTCMDMPSVCSLCGNGTVEGPEQCDDANSDMGDGCHMCAQESGWTCDPVCRQCGNGVREGTEGCDDANLDDGDGCSSGCAIESGWSCMGDMPSFCSFCGDGVQEGAEACDDHNSDVCGTCNADCSAAASVPVGCLTGVGCNSDADCLSMQCSPMNECR